MYGTQSHSVTTSIVCIFTVRSLISLVQSPAFSPVCSQWSPSTDHPAAVWLYTIISALCTHLSPKHAPITHVVIPITYQSSCVVTDHNYLYTQSSSCVVIHWSQLPIHTVIILCSHALITITYTHSHHLVYSHWSQLPIHTVIILCSHWSQLSTHSYNHQLHGVPGTVLLK